MVSHHAEFERSKKVVPDCPFLLEDFVNADKNVVYDSMGIFILGPFDGLHSPGWVAKAMRGAIWPQEVQKGNRVIGFRTGSYQGRGPDDTVAEVLTKAVFEDCQRWQCFYRRFKDTWKLPLHKYQDLKNKFKPAWQQASMAADHVAPAASASDTWPQCGVVHEMLCDWRYADDDGNIIGFGAHMPLLIKLTVHAEFTEGPYVGGLVPTGRNRSEYGHYARTVKRRKLEVFKELGQWPWWIHHDSERLYHLPKSFAILKDEHGNMDFHEGGGYHGVRWRLQREWYVDQGRPHDVTLYENPWVETYGVPWHIMSLNWTERFYRHARASGHTGAMIAASKDLQRFYDDWAASPETVVFDEDGQIFDMEKFGRGKEYSEWTQRTYRHKNRTSGSGGSGPENRASGTGGSGSRARGPRG